MNIIGIICALMILFGCAAAGRHTADISRDAVTRAYNGAVSRISGVLTRVEELIERSLNLNGGGQSGH